MLFLICWKTYFGCSGLSKWRVVPQNLPFSIASITIGVDVTSKLIIVLLYYWLTNLILFLFIGLKKPIPKYPFCSNDEICRALLNNPRFCIRVSVVVDFFFFKKSIAWKKPKINHWKWINLNVNSQFKKKFIQIQFNT